MITNKLGRPMLAAMFISGGIDQLRNPKAKVPLAEDVTDVIAEPLGLPDDTEKLVRINGAVQVAAGSLLFINKLPRLASLALAGSLVPTTLAAHRFWEEEDPDKKQMQQIQFMKNASMLGGLLVSAGDTDGKPSVGWRAKRALKRSKSNTAKLSEAAAKASAAGSKASKKASKASRKASKRMNKALHEARDQATPVIASASKTAAATARDAIDKAAPIARDAIDKAAPIARDAIDKAAPIARDAVDKAAPVAKQLTEQATKAASTAADRASQLVRAA